MPQRLSSWDSSLPLPLGSSEESTSTSSRSDEKSRWRLRGLLWRMQLGVLPSRFDSVDPLRRAAADGRRRYADLRRRLLVDPHLIEEGQKPPDVSMDNPLSLDPDSVWGKYFRNAEIERVIDKDLTRLYPEHGNFFQGSGCQAMFRRILLVWALIHPQLSYRQGMHELLAPLLYVLHIDVLQLSQIKKRYEDLFDDRFDEDGDSGGFKASRMKLPFDLSGAEQPVNGQQRSNGIFEHDELNVDLKVIVMGSDAYGAEGELGALFSARFMEHDAYCLFDALLGGGHDGAGAVRMIDYFVTSGVPDASAALYRTLAAADFPLYAHLVELGVQPQYFALRWLRLLFGREFGLEDLLMVWDAIFSASNDPVQAEDGTIASIRSSVISAIAVSLLFHSRAALLAAPDATGCLQRLLNSPHIQDVRTFIENARHLQPLALQAAGTPPPPVAKLSRGTKTSPQKSGVLRQGSAPCSPELLKLFLAEGYWEGKWKNSVLQKSISEDSETISRAAAAAAAAAGASTSSEAPREKPKSRRESFPRPGVNGSGAPRKPASTSRLSERKEAEKPVEEAEVRSVSSSDGDTKSEGTSSEPEIDPVKVVSVPVDPGGVEERKQEVPVDPGSVEERKQEVVPESNGSEEVFMSDPLGGAVRSLKIGELKITDHRKASSLGEVVRSPRIQDEALVSEDSPARAEKEKPSDGVLSAKKQLTFRKEDSGELKKAKGPVTAKSLGQAMVEHIQVLENVLSQKMRDGDQMSKAIIGGKGHVSAMVAFAELRKISNSLLQM